MNQSTTRTAEAAGQGAQESVLAQIARLQTLSHHELQAKWRELYDAPPPPVWNRPFLLRRLAYRIQELAFGGLPEETKRELERIAEADARARPTRKKEATPRGRGLPVVGTRLVRRWQGRDYEVVVNLGGTSSRVPVITRSAPSPRKSPAPTGTGGPSSASRARTIRTKPRRRGNGIRHDDDDTK